MRKHILLLIVATLVSATIVAAEKDTFSELATGSLTLRYKKKLLQRKQLRDLVTPASHDIAHIRISVMERLHVLVTAKMFDKVAIKEQMEK